MCNIYNNDALNSTDRKLHKAISLSVNFICKPSSALLDSTYD